MPGRGPKLKGDEFERDVKLGFMTWGFSPDRVSLKAQAGKSFICDIEVTIAGIVRRIECKRRKASFGTLYKWLKDNWLLAIRDDREECLVVMRFKDFLELARRAEDGNRSESIAVAVGEDICA